MAYIHVLSLSTGGAHPLTNTLNPIYSSKFLDVADCSRRIYNELLGGRSECLYIVVSTWKSRDVVAKIVAIVEVNLPLTS